MRESTSQAAATTNSDGPESRGRGATLVLGQSSPLACRLADSLLTAGESVVFLGSTPEPQEPGAVAELISRHRENPALWLLDGDVRAVDFGLSGRIYQRLIERTTRVVSCLESRVEPSNVETSSVVRAARELVEFVRAGGGAGGVVFLSSVLVFGTHVGSVDESDFAVQQGFSSRLDEALAVGEKIVRMLDGTVPLSILRSFPVSGSVEPAEVFPLGPLGELARVVQLAPRNLEVSLSDRPFQLETEDRLVAVIAHLLRTPPPSTAEGPGLRTLHLVDNNAPTVRQVVWWLARHFEKQLRDTPRAGRGRLASRRNKSVGARMIQGWALKFERTQAERTLGGFLDPSSTSLLETWYPRDPQGEDLAGGESATTAFGIEAGSVPRGSS